MSDRNLSCEERFRDALSETEQRLAEQYRLIDTANEADDYDREEDLREEIQPYGISTIVTMKLELSGGGPADWLEVELGQSRFGFEVVGVVYHFADWFDHAEQVVTEQEAPGMWRTAEYYAEFAEGLLKSRGKWS